MSEKSVKALTVVGARPQFIKAATVSKAIAEAAGIRETLVHTGQHYDRNMSDVFFDELGIPSPAYHLGIGSLSHGAQTARMLEALEGVMLQERPDIVIVYGDTNSTLAGGLAASKLHIPIAHVEAGLRSFNRAMPEEINRVLVDHLSDVLFTPGENAANNLVAEGISIEKIRTIGDVMYDAALMFRSISIASDKTSAAMKFVGNQYALATIHRQENTSDRDRTRKILKALSIISKEMPIIFPCHPRIRDSVENFLHDNPSRIYVIDPVGYLEMLHLETRSQIILTDSGGVQKEAFFHKVPCVTLRQETEWTELVHSGWNTLADPNDVDAIVSTYHSQLGTQGLDQEVLGPKGASKRAVDYILSFLAS